MILAVINHWLSLHESFQTGRVKASRCFLWDIWSQPPCHFRLLLMLCHRGGILSLCPFCIHELTDSYDWLASLWLTGHGTPPSLPLLDTCSCGIHLIPTLLYFVNACVSHHLGEEFCKTSSVMKRATSSHKTSIFSFWLTRYLSNICWYSIPT